MNFFFCILIFVYVYEDADSLIVINDSLVICGYHHYNFKVDISGSGKLKIQQWSYSDSAGWLCLDAPAVSIQGASSIVGTGLGCLGGTTSHPDGYGTGYGHAGDPSGGSGGGAGYGGAGGDGGDLGAGEGGIAYGYQSDTVIAYGSGGGAGELGTVDGFGGNGGASFYAKALKMIIDSTDIACDGEAGNEGSLEAGGGGSGGGIMLRADTVILHGVSLSAEGGAGGPAVFGGGGGAGGGRVKIYYGTMLDTVNLIISSSGGSGGVGGEENGYDGAAGSIYIAPIVGIDRIGEEVPVVFSIWPNPTRGTFQICSGKTPRRVRIYDVGGRLIAELKLLKHTARVDLGGLGSGSYFLKDAGNLKAVGEVILLK